MQYKLLEKRADVDRLCRLLRQCTRFAFDTEFVAERQFRPTLCLIQIATDDQIFLLDPLLAGNPSELWEVITEGDAEVVVHGGRADVRICYFWSGGRLPRRLFDVQVAAGLVGLEFPMSYANLVREVLGVEILEHATLSDWKRRPLRPEQLRYAAEDVRYLLEIRDRLAAQLDSLGRLQWALEEFARRAQRAVADEEGKTEPWRKMKGVKNLNARQLGVLRELYLWRQDRAARENVPPRQICPDHVLVEAARKMPRKVAALDIRGIRGEYRQPMVDVIKRAIELPEEELPEVEEKDPPQLQLLTQLLSAVLQSICVDYRIAPGLAATQGDIRNWLRAQLGDGPAPESPFDSGWRQAYITPRLRACLEGKLTVRVQDPHKENPLSLMDIPTWE